MDNQTNNRIREEYITLYDMRGSWADVYHKKIILEQINKKIDELLKSQERSLRINVGMLRQWLNEDVITDSSKLVENEDLLSWLIKQSK